MLLALVGTLASATVYLVSARLVAGGWGYPLDDSWIHQTLARNLVLYGEMAVNPGQPVAVSTAPLWTALLVPGYLLGVPPLPGESPTGQAGLPPFLWTHLVGGGSLVLLAWSTFRMGRALLQQDSRVPWLAGLLMLVEWHLVWAALSGMETVLFATLSLAVLTEALAKRLTRPWLLGFLVGLMTLMRPEAILLGPLLGAWALFTVPSARWTPLLAFGAALALTILPVVGLNLVLSGSPLPATFFAKNAAYGVGPDVRRYIQYLVGAVIELGRGPLLLLYPGLIYGLARRFSGMAGAWHLPLAWCALLVGAYMVWLPALYHHGRYLFPLIPIVSLYGLEGGRLLLNRLPFVLLPRVAPVLLGLVVALSWARGAQVYAENVRYINEQQVAFALWARDNTPTEAVLATHDIGAMGYFSQRTLVDIAGLASPELVSSPKDISRILGVLEEKGVDYIILLPEWYPPLYDALRADPRIQGVPRGSPGAETPSGARPFEILRRIRNESK